MHKTVVITGSTRGIGRGLALSFLRLGCNVVICGRGAETVAATLAEMERIGGSDRFQGQTCDVTERSQVSALWMSTVEQFARVDIWINNAGVRPPREPLIEHAEADIRRTLDVNLVGTLHGCAVAMAGMRDQPLVDGLRGAIYNMEGLGSDGRTVTGSNLYGATKQSVRYLTKALAKEHESSGVLVGALSPGMVLTDLLLGEYDRDSADWERVSRVFNILADRVETVTPWLAERALANTRHGATLAWLTPQKAAWRFAKSLFTQRDLFEDDSRA